jgi:hypothetical protein
MSIEFHITSAFANLAQIIDPEEGLQYPSWLGYAVIVFFYSVVVFFDEIPKGRRAIFSEQNKRSPTRVLLIHISLLAVLFCALRAGPYVARYLPHWMTNEFDNLEGGHTSIARLLFFAGAMLIAGCEKLFLETTGSGSTQISERDESSRSHPRNS